jgi:hypothetical protein
MTPRTALLLAAITVVGMACGREGAPSSSGRVAGSSGTEIARSEQAKLGSPARGNVGSAGPRVAPTAGWRIDVGRVGSIAIGRRLPDAVLGEELASHYLALYIADALPVDAFVYDAPAMLVILSSGPFRALFSSTGSSAKQATETLGSKAAAAARNGAEVQVVMVRGAGASTAAGIGVGSTVAVIAAAYPDLQLMPIPETLGNDACVATTKSLPGVSFMFESCDTGIVIRIDVRSPVR